MSVYSNTQILQALREGHIVCVPFEPKHVSEASLDITLGQHFYRTERTGDRTLYNPFDEADVRRYFGQPLQAVPHGEWAQANGMAPVVGIPLDFPVIPIRPGERILTHSHEFFGIVPPGACELKSRSTWGRNGIAVCFDAGWIDPGYINRLTLEVYNLNQHETVLLPVGERIGQIVFHDTGEVDGNYGEGRDGGFSGKYQTGTDLQELIRTWSPEQMLPKAYKDKRSLPAAIPTEQAQQVLQQTEQSETIEEAVVAKKNSVAENNKGIFVVVEGVDGSGKSTQFDLLAKRLEQNGHDVATFKFPRYDEPSSYFVREYLAGKYGKADEVGPYTASLFYALDRYAGAEAIRQALAQGKVVLVDRYAGSNMAHQGGKFYHADQRRGYFIWLDNLEFEMLHIPRPDLNFVLHVPAKVSQELLAKTDKEQDIHEANLEHLQRSVEVYNDMCQLFPKDFTRIDCVRSGELLSIEQVNNLLWEKLSPLLPKATKPKKADAKVEAQVASVSVEAQNPYIQKTENGLRITKEGTAFLNKNVSCPDGNVYAFKSGVLDPITIAAAMARLSRRGDDMRAIILDEFATAAGKDAKLLQRVITAYGDDSVQQLAGLHFVVEGASMLLAKKLEWGRLAAYLEQSTRYIYFDQKDSNGQYRYVVPSGLKADTAKQYRQSMDQIFDLYSDMVHKLTEHITATSSTPKDERDGAWRSAVRAQACDAVRAVLPIATKTTVGVFASGQALESLIMHLQSDELSEARQTGDLLLQQGREVMPMFLERADKPDRGGAMIAYRANTAKAVKAIAAKELANARTDGKTEPITLADYWPKNELSLVTDMLYEHSDLPLTQIQDAVNAWPYAQKVETLKAYMGERLNRRHKPGRALEKAHYSWDLVSEFAVFKDLQRHRMVDDLEWQQLTPRYGFDVPQLIENADLTEQFEKCFAISLQLHSLLQSSGHELEAQYATLQGHKMRWKVTYNAREAFHLHEIRTSPQGHPAYRKFVQEMHEKVAEVHPLLAESMQFVSRGEDAELTRLAAERYTQFKLNQLDQEKSAE